jgi:hypothetical protein
MWHVWGVEKGMQGFGGRSEGERPLGRPRLRCENNIKLEFTELQ